MLGFPWLHSRERQAGFRLALSRHEPRLFLGSGAAADDDSDLHAGARGDHETRAAGAREPIRVQRLPLLWQLFSDLLARSVGIFVHNSALLKKANLPKLAFPIIVALSGLSNFGVILVLFLGFMVVIGSFPAGSVFAMIPVVLLVVGFALGLGVLLGTVNVFYRDIEQSTSMVLQFWFWLTPIVYPGRALPGFAAHLLEWNPMWPIVHFAQTIFLEDRVPDWSTLLYPAVVAMIFLALGLVAFRRLSGEIVDEL
jgi:lipopolysaccharide transport system permease protein